MCDLEAMFHQFKVKGKDRNYLRFYWWENGDTTKTPERLCIYTEMQPLLDARTLGSRKLLSTMSASLAPTQLTLSGKISMLTMASVATVNREHQEYLRKRGNDPTWNLINCQFRKRPPGFPSASDAEWKTNSLGSLPR